jgi:O-acetylserine/cysteine efflux transporter
VNPLDRFGPRDLAVALAINLVWGLNIVFVKLSVTAVPPFTAALLRQSMVMLVCLPWLRIVPGRMRDLVALSIVVGGAFFAVVNLSLVVTENVGALAIAGQLGAPFSLILAIVFLGERIGVVRVFGMALAMGGCALLVFDPAAAREVPGLLLTVLASMLWATGSLLQRRLIGVGIPTMYAWVGLGGMIVLGPLALFFETPVMTGTVAIPAAAFGWIAFSALGSTLIGSGGMAWLLQRHPVTTVIPVTLGVPVIGVVASSIVFGNPLTPVMVLGGAIALAGVAIVTMRTASAKEAESEGRN